MIAVHDGEMRGVVRVLLDLDDGDLNLRPEALREMLQRLHDLLTREAAKRPSNRPRLNDGAFVARLIECGASRAKAIRIVTVSARKTDPKKTEAAVKKAYERYAKTERQK